MVSFTGNIWAHVGISQLIADGFILKRKYHELFIRFNKKKKQMLNVAVLVPGEQKKIFFSHTRVWHRGQRSSVASVDHLS